MSLSAGRVGDAGRRRPWRTASPAGLLPLARVGPLAGVALLVVACTPPGLPAVQSPQPGTTSAAAAAASSVVTVGVDSAVGGFNPYLPAAFSPAGQAVAGLVLPAVSRIGDDGVRAVDPMVITKAEVSSTSPFTVTYRINRSASWSDGTPVTAEDFEYLRKQVAASVGGIGASAYRAVQEIRSTDAGKTVEVVFSRPVADWLTMFSPLLPAHILKDAPGGFTSGLDNGLPVSAGPYLVRQVDRVTGLITLSRNDKYWGDQPGPAAVVLRMGTDSELVAALRRGDLQALLFRPGHRAAEELQATVPAAQRRQVPLPATTQLLFNTRGGASASPVVRRAIALSLGRDVLVDALTGSEPEALLPAVQAVLLPGAGGAISPVAPILPGKPAEAARLLQDNGYRLGAVYRSSAAGPLRVTLGYPVGDPRIANAGRTVQAQLAVVGIEVDLIADTAGNLVQRLSDGQVDAALLTLGRGSSDAISAADAASCAPAPSPVGQAQQSVSGQSLSGFCPPELAATADTLLARPTSAGIAALVSRLDSESPFIPIGEPVATFAVSEALRSVTATTSAGWLFGGPLAGLAGWPVR